MANKKLFNYKILKNAYSKQPYHWICTAGNGEIRSTSENYTQKHNAINAVASEIKYRKKGVCAFEDCTGEAGKVSKRLEKLLK